jgi:hypothetical protein
MQLQDLPHSIFRPKPPPLWYVTNGELTVGPVVTPLLMRGVEHGRVPDYCHVRTPVGRWRKLDSVREVAAMSSKGGAVPHPAVQQLREAMGAFDAIRCRPQRLRDEDELCYEVTRLTRLVTGAESAMFHYRGRYGRSLVTRSVLGPMSTERLGYALPESDLILRSARRGQPVFGPPYGPTEDALAMRFASSKGGSGAVAMIPVFVGSELTAMLELSRPGHAFRRSDLQRAEGIVQRALRQRTN